MAKLTQIIPLLICWELWKARNKAILYDYKMIVGQVFHHVLELLHFISLAHLFVLENCSGKGLQQLGLWLSFIVSKPKNA